MYQPLINQLNTYIAGELTHKSNIVYEWYFCVDILSENDPGDVLYEAYCITRQQIHDVLPEGIISDYWQDSDSIGFTLNLLPE